ncbi:MAG: hypothetical protein M1269_08295 [Chloroflexi bacterium]|nr:hypothetical protein [Chloroflexota bacterium]
MFVLRKIGQGLKGLDLFLIGTIIFCITTIAPAYALRIPETDLQEIHAATETIQTTLASLRSGVGVLLFLLVVSMGVNVFLTVTLWRAQEQVKDSLETLKNIDLFKQKATKMIQDNLTVKNLLAREQAGDRVNLGDEVPLPSKKADRSREELPGELAMYEPSITRGQEEDFVIEPIGSAEPGPEESLVILESGFRTPEELVWGAPPRDIVIDETKLKQVQNK